MKNYEKYKDFVIDNIKNSVPCELAKKVYGTDKCFFRQCSECAEFVAKWLDEEYKPNIDWSKVPVDTPVIVKERSGLERKRHFSRYKEGCIEPFVCFNDGKTSFTADFTTDWNNCRLAHQEDIEKYSI